MNEVFELTEKQKKAFLKLKAAYKACKKEGIYFVNNYSNLQAYNGEYVCGYIDSNPINNKIPNAVSGHETIKNSFNITSEWCDDAHLFILTEKGIKKFKEEKNE